MASASNSTTLYANTGSPYTNATLTASFNENSTSTSNNTSNITVTATQKIGNADWSSSYTSSLQIYWYDNNNNSGGQLVATTNVSSQGRNATITASGTITVAHKSDGSLNGYAKAVWTKGGNSNWTPNSGNVSTANTTLTSIPRAATITSAPNFTDMDNPTISYSNKAGNSATTLQVGIFNTAGNQSYASYRDISKTGTSYTFELTEQERQNLRYATINSPTLAVRFYIKTVIGGNTFYSYSEKILTIVDANPTFTATYADDNASTVAITGDDQLIVRNQSQLEINVANISAKKGASISTVVASINGTTYTGTISGTACTINVGQLNLSSNTTATVTVTDSRAYSSSQTLNITVLNWELPTAIVTMQRHNNYYSNTDITVDGSYSSVDNKNAMTLKVRYKKTSDSTWSSYTTVQDNVSQTFNLDNEYEWDVQVLVSDLFGSTTYNLTLSRGMPIIYFDRLKSSTGFNCFPEDAQSVEVNGVNVMRSVMTRCITSNISNLSVNTYTKIAMNATNSFGSKLTATNDGGIKIGSGVSKILVSGRMLISSNVVGSYYIRICANSTNTTLGWVTHTNNSTSATFESIDITPTLADVHENDVIYMYYYVPASSGTIYGGSFGAQTSLTVETVG
jgi:hypothetical protein